MNIGLVACGETVRNLPRLARTNGHMYIPGLLDNRQASEW